MLCNHVLEHVDDHRALAEIRRILKPGGRALLTVPIVEGWETTFEDHRVAGAAERERIYGQPDHIRIYGRDFRDRVKAAGFELTEHTVAAADAPVHALLPGEKLFVATRPAFRTAASTP